MTDNSEICQSVDSEDPQSCLRSNSSSSIDIEMTENSETCQLVDSEDPQSCLDDEEESTTMRENGFSRVGIILLLVGICGFAGVMWVGYEGGLALNNNIHTPLISSDDHSSSLDDQQQQRMRGPAASMTEATARDIAMHKKQDADSSSTSNFDDIKDLSSLDKTLLEYLSRSSFARSKTLQLLTDEYISEKSSDVLMSDRLEDTIEAMDSVVSDGEPIQVEGYPYLFVGSVGASSNEKALKKHNITDIISWSATARCNNFSNINYMCITDVSDYKDMKKHLDDRLNAAVDYIESARKAGGHVMSQCWYGRNRSVTLLVAYLVKYEGMDGEDALHLIQRTRPIADSYRDVVKIYGRKYGTAKGYKVEKKGKGDKGKRDE